MPPDAAKRSNACRTASMAWSVNAAAIRRRTQTGDPGPHIRTKSGHHDSGWSHQGTGRADRTTDPYFCDRVLVVSGGQIKEIDKEQAHQLVVKHAAYHPE